jgi:hypothetical protein
MLLLFKALKALKPACLTKNATQIIAKSDKKSESLRKAKNGHKKEW